MLQTGERRLKYQIVPALLTWQLLSLTSRSENKKMKKKIMIKKLILMLTYLIRQNYQMKVITIEISIMMKMTLDVQSKIEEFCGFLEGRVWWLGDRQLGAR